MISSSALLIRVTGHDRPGVTHAVTSILARYDARVAFHAKPPVRSGASQSISSMGLDGILYLIGVRDRDFGV